MAITLLKAPDTWSTIRNPIPVQYQADAAWASNTSYVIRLDIQTESSWGSGSWTTIETVEEVPSSANTCTWNLSTLAESLEPARSVPNLLATPAITKLTDAAVRFRIIPYEVVDGSATAGTTIGPFTVISGATPWSDAQTVNVYRQAGKFLTYAYRSGKNVTEYQPEWLMFIVPTGTTSVTLKCTAVDLGGTTNTLTLGLSLSSLVAGDLVRIPAGYRQLGLHLIGSGYKSWTLWLENQSSTRISETMTYAIEQLRFQSTQRFYCFWNDLGGFDTLRSTGDLVAKRKNGAVLIDSIPNPLAWINTRTRQRKSTGWNTQYEQNSGYLAAEESEWAKGILNSNDVYRLGEGLAPNYQALGSLMPIVIDAGTTPVWDDGERLYYFAFSYEEGYTNQ